MRTPSRRATFLWIVAALMSASGVVHAVIFIASGTEWDGPLSWRKPILFGLSTGVTAASLAWVWRHLAPTRGDHWLTQILGWSLLLEVAAITLQTWRGAPSHFNHSTTFDTIIEQLMLVWISVATLIVVWLTVRSWGGLEVDPEQRLAIRAGLVGLVVSCVIGYAISAWGWRLHAMGRSPEIYGTAGVLKFPHGICLHAIQTLPIAGWIWRSVKAADLVRRMGWLVAAHGFALAYALWQTLSGRTRLDLDAMGGALLMAAGLCLAWSCAPSVWLSRRRPALPGVAAPQESA